MSKIKFVFQKGCLLMLLLAMLPIGFTACDDDDSNNNARATGDPYNPGKTTTITRLLPEAFKANDQLIIYGDNFGNDESAVIVTIGGAKAAVINVAGNMIYCLVPTKIDNTEVVVTVIDKEANPLQIASFVGKVPEEIPNVRRERIVSTLVGHTLQANEEMKTVYGSFDEAAGFDKNATLKYDPINPKILYICYDGSDRGIEYLDFEKEEYHQLMNKDAFGTDRLRDIAFSKDGKYMIVAVDRADNDTKTPSLFILERNDEGTFEGATPQILASFKQCNTVAVHPVNGEVYFNSFSDGQLFRLELDDYFNAIKENGKIDKDKWDGYQHNEEDEYTKGFHEIFQIQDNDNESRLCIHPSGDYAYILVKTKHYILKTEYDWEKKEFKQPYTFAGIRDQADFRDGVGQNARFKEPYYGVFVKNPSYEKDGSSDIYDFYIADRVNFCVRTLTPDGVARIYAGRANHGDNDVWGTEDGKLLDVARFRDITGIAYDEEEDTFYLVDQFNQRVRKIAPDPYGAIIED